MTIDIGRLESQLLRMSEEGAPGREFCEAISELARTGRFAQLREVLPGIVYNEEDAPRPNGGMDGFGHLLGLVFAVMLMIAGAADQGGG